MTVPDVDPTLLVQEYINTLAETIHREYQYKVLSQKLQSEVDQLRAQLAPTETTQAPDLP